mmetsp:Transcript_34852/g.110061  ORF Transcript_34852/g.110061 Transcript_34852/m.110061 type:complete len:221 (-) Transcript_34852:2280-2942(-)
MHQLPQFPLAHGALDCARGQVPPLLPLHSHLEVLVRGPQCRDRPQELLHLGAQGVPLPPQLPRLLPVLLPRRLQRCYGHALPLQRRRRPPLRPYLRLLQPPLPHGLGDLEPLPPPRLQGVHVPRVLHALRLPRLPLCVHGRPPRPQLRSSVLLPEPLLLQSDHHRIQLLVLRPQDRVHQPPLVQVRIEWGEDGVLQGRGPFHLLVHHGPCFHPHRPRPEM